MTIEPSVWRLRCQRCSFQAHSTDRWRAGEMLSEHIHAKHQDESERDRDDALSAVDTEPAG